MGLISLYEFSTVNFSVFLGKTIFRVMNLLPMIGYNWLIPFSTCFLGTFNSNDGSFFTQCVFYLFQCLFFHIFNNA